MDIVDRLHKTYRVFCDTEEIRAVMDKAAAEIGSLRAELAAAKRELNDAEEARNDAETRLLASLATGQDADEIAAKNAEIAGLQSLIMGFQAKHDEIVRDHVDWVKSLQYEASQDAEEKARLKEALEFYSNRESWEQDGTRADGYMSPMFRDMGAVARAALACRPQPARNRPLPETRCDCCDNGLDDAWEFCPFCGQQHPDAAGALACRPHKE